MDPSPLFNKIQILEALREQIHSVVQRNPAAVEKWASGLGLQFQSVNEPDVSVCFAQSPEIRDEYRTYFTVGDLIHYFSAILYFELSDNCRVDIADIKLELIPPPLSADEFWTVVRKGRQLRHSGSQ